MTPEQALALAKAVSDIYADSTTSLLQTIARAVAKGMDRPAWAEERLAELLRLRRNAQVIVAAMQQHGTAQVLDVLEEAYRGGRLTPLTSPGMTGTSQRAVTALAADTQRILADTSPRVLRWTEDVYRRTIAETVSGSVTGTSTRVEAAARALDRFAAQGVTGFTDTAGRSWRLESYVEMATRTATGRAHLAGTVQRYQDTGVELVIVSNSPQECPLCRPFEGHVLSVNGPLAAPDLPDGITYMGSLSDAISAGLHHPNCFPGEVPVSAPTGVRAADTRWYEGDLVVIHTAGGDELPVTPNHPVLTPEGWVAAGELVIGQHVLRYRFDAEGVGAVGPDDEQVETSISKVYDALREASPVPPVRVPAAPEQFHGDGGQADVHVVLADGFLRDWVEAAGLERSGDGSLLVGGAGLGALLPDGALLEVGQGAGHAADGVVGGSGEGGAFLGGHALCAAHRGLGAADPGSTVLEAPGDGVLGDAESGREVALSLAGQVELDHVVLVERRVFAGHVYNLQSGDGWYTASGIVVHNCTHRTSAYTPGLTQPMGDVSNPKGYEDRQRQRELERRVRESRRRVAVLEELGDTDTLRRQKALLGRRRRDLSAHNALTGGKTSVSARRTSLRVL